MENSNQLELQTFLRTACPIYEHIGLMVESTQDGIYRCRLPFEPKNTNHLSTIHAALQWGIAEAVGGIAILNTFDAQEFEGLFLAVKSATIEFVRPARTDVVAEAVFETVDSSQLRDRIRANKEARVELKVVLRSTTGEIVANLTAQYVLRPKRAEAVGL